MRSKEIKSHFLQTQSHAVRKTFASVRLKEWMVGRIHLGRLIPDLDFEALSTITKHIIQFSNFTISALANRMLFQLEEALAQLNPRKRLTAPVFLELLQLTSGGKLINLIAETPKSTAPDPSDFGNWPIIRNPFWHKKKPGQRNKVSIENHQNWSNVEPMTNEISLATVCKELCGLFFSICWKKNLQPFWRPSFFPIGVNPCQNPELFSIIVTRASAHGWYIFTPSALYLWTPDKMLVLLIQLCDYVFDVVKYLKTVFGRSIFLRSINPHRNLRISYRETFCSLALKKHSKKFSDFLHWETGSRLYLQLNISETQKPWIQS